MPPRTKPGETTGAAFGRPTLYNKEIVLKTRPRPQDIAAKNHPQNFVKNYEKNLKKALTHTGVLLYDSQAPVKGRSLR